jgi:hypothetical protein
VHVVLVKVIAFAAAHEIAPFWNRAFSAACWANVVECSSSLRNPQARIRAGEIAGAMSGEPVQLLLAAGPNSNRKSFSGDTPRVRMIASLLILGGAVFGVLRRAACHLPVLDLRYQRRLVPVDPSVARSLADSPPIELILALPSDGNLWSLV